MSQDRGSIDTKKVKTYRDDEAWREVAFHRDGFSVGADVVRPAVGAWVSTVAIIFPTVPWQPIQHSVQHSQINSSQSAIKTDKLHVSKGMVPVIWLLYRVSDVKKGKLTNAVGT
jgi:hypothetical protein